MHEIRKDPLLNRWVLIAPDRARRPQLLHTQKTDETDPARRQSAIDSDPFLEGRESETPDEVFAIRDPGSNPNGPGWRVRVVPNRFPAVSPNPQSEPQELLHIPAALGEYLKGFGHHEVIVECPHYEEHLEYLPEVHIADVLIAYRERIRELKKVTGIKHITIFKNQGEYAGASVGHSHSQLVALPFVPRTIAEEIEGCSKFQIENTSDSDFFRSLCEANFYTEDRIVEETKHFVTHCPFASRFPCEMLVLPLIEYDVSSRYEDTSDDVLFELAGVLKRNLTRLNKIFDNPPYNFVLHNCPFEDNTGASYRWHFEIYPRLSGIAGFEMGTDTYINPLPPEEAARMLREADPTFSKN